MFELSRWKWTKTRVVVAVGAFLLLLIAFVFTGGKDGPRQREKILIPEGYTGWVIMEYGVKGTASTPVINGYKVYKIPSNARKRSGINFTYLKTLSTLDRVTQDEYYYVTLKGLVPIPESPDTRGNQLPGIAIQDEGSFNGGDGIPETGYFFVGTKSEYDKAEAGPEPRSEEEVAR